MPAEPRFERLALLIQRQLLGVDVDMRLEALPLREFATRVATGQFDAFLSELIASHGLGFTYMMWHSKPPSPFFRTGYAGADAALDRVRAARTDDETRPPSTRCSARCTTIRRRRSSTGSRRAAP